MLPIEWALQQIANEEDKRDWSKLPADYEQCAVNRIYMRIKPHFCKKREIAKRIAASRAQTFVELRAVIN
jgi:hypothetical protein